MLATTRTPPPVKTPGAPTYATIQFFPENRPFGNRLEFRLRVLFCDSGRHGYQNIRLSIDMWKSFSRQQLQYIAAVQLEKALLRMGATEEAAYSVRTQAEDFIGRIPSDSGLL